jgi:tetratricopeptide (TPR) repeat protein
MRAPTDVAAIRMLAEVAARLGRDEDAETLLARCLELAPGFRAARHNHALVLNRCNRHAEALQEADALLAAEPANASYRNLKAAILSRIGDADQAIALYEAIVAGHPRHPKLWTSYGHALKTAGFQPRAIEPIVVRSRWIRPWRGVLEPRQPQDVPLRRRRHRRDAARTGAQRPGQRAPPTFEFALGKALEDAATTRSRSSITSRQHAAQGDRLP